MILGTLLLAAAQPAASAAATMPTCSLVTPRGDRIEFFIWGGDDPNQFNFTSAPGSAWPRHTLAGTRRNLERNVPWFVIGGADGVALMLNAPEAGATRRAATIVGRSRRLVPLPLAYGFCEERPAPETAVPPTDLNATEADSPVFNPELWPDDDCALLLSDGRRIRFKVTLMPLSDVQFQSEALWPGAPVTTRLRWATDSRADFSSPNGPQGNQLFMINGTLGTRVISLRRVGGTAAAGLSGYGICGYRGLHRAPGRGG
jgi:hypothetical protein